MVKPAGGTLPVLCSRPWTSFRIDDHKGNIKPCCWTPLEFGNVNQQSIEEIWNGPAYVRMRELMARGEVESICAADCPVLLGEFPESEAGAEPRSAACRENWLTQQAEIAERRVVLTSRPTKMRIVPTVKCNLNCEFCYQDRDDTTELPEQIDRILTDFFPVLDELVVIGGEPLATRECLSIIEQMDPRLYPDLHLALITNGTTVSAEVVELLSARRMSWVLVSVDAATPETYKKVRGGKFSKVIEGVNRLNEIRHRQGASWGLLMGFIFMRSNMHEALDFVRMAEDLRVDFTFQPVFGSWHSETYYHIPEEVERARHIVAELDSYLASKGLAGKNKTERLHVKLNSVAA